MMEKLLSGRLWLTIISGLVFAYVSFMKIIQPDVIATILTMVFVSYFQRQDRTKGDTNGK